ncbi:serine hydrolase domain-containing protein [Hugenholtzia roseola]|uniref:serine hydrolase domain-containing protein n=1 Tax=Hugenholtzia roseola TaxID=1002 RepID=UPI00047EBC17|nr:serine hydrolase [Hugenholtzia roseola]
MKILMKTLKISLLVVGLLLVGVVITAYSLDMDYLLKGVRTIYLQGHQTAFLGDYKEFDNRTIKNAPDQRQPWAQHQHYNQKAIPDILQQTHQELGTVAFLIIKNDSLLHEYYAEGYDANSHTNSFSMAKSIVTAALGHAIKEGKIKSLDQKVVDFLPELKGKYASDLSVGDLSSMASGLAWDENYYSPFSITTKAYFYDDLDKMMLELEVSEPPSQRFHYLSGNTQLLGMVIEKATQMPLADYISESFWKPLGAENPAFWQLDSENGTEKAYCCIASNARDFARFGKLFKDLGHWNGKQILDTAFVQTCIRPRFADSPEYGYGFWLSNYKNKAIFYLRGHLGQNVIVIPEDNLIIVRLGHQNGGKSENDPHDRDFYTYIDQAYQMLP